MIVMNLDSATQRVRSMIENFAHYAEDANDVVALRMVLSVAERGMIPSTADGEIRSLLISNAAKGKFGDIKIDESKSTLHILVHVLEHLLRPPQVWTYKPSKEKPTAEEIKSLTKAMATATPRPLENGASGPCICQCDKPLASFSCVMKCNKCGGWQSIARSFASNALEVRLPTVAVPTTGSITVGLVEAKECTCKSLINGHEENCPLGKK